MGYNVLCERFTHDAGRTYHSHVPSLHGDSRLVDILTYGRVLRKSAGRKGFGVEMVGKQRIKGLFTYFLIMDSMDSMDG